MAEIRNVDSSKLKSDKYLVLILDVPPLRASTRTATVEVPFAPIKRPQSDGFDDLNLLMPAPLLNIRGFALLASGATMIDGVKPLTEREIGAEPPGMADESGPRNTNTHLNTQPRRLNSSYTTKEIKNDIKRAKALAF